MVALFSEVAPILAPAVVFLLLCLSLWRSVFRRLFGLRNRMTVKVREEVMKDHTAATNTVIALSTGSIVLTFSILQLWPEQPVLGKTYLLVSWAGFALAVIVGVVVKLIGYVFRTTYLMLMNAMDDLQGARESGSEQTEIEEARAFAKSGLQRMQRLEGQHLILLFLQPLLFVLGILYLIAFATTNLM